MNQCVSALRLGNNGLSDAAVAVLVEGIKANPQIQELDLSMNQVGRAGAISLGELLLSKVNHFDGLQCSTLSVAHLKQ